MDESSITVDKTSSSILCERRSENGVGMHIELGELLVFLEPLTRTGDSSSLPNVPSSRFKLNHVEERLASLVRNLGRHGVNEYNIVCRFLGDPPKVISPFIPLFTLKQINKIKNKYVEQPQNCGGYRSSQERNQKIYCIN
jgi:hypothetical protein